MKTLFVITLFASSLFAQVEYSRKSQNYTLLPKFYIDLDNYADQDSAKSKIDVFLKIPYSNITFIKTPIGYSARYSVTVSFYDSDKDNLLLEKQWNEKVNTQNFKLTSSSTSFNLSYKSFSLNPGEYSFECKVEDLESRKYYSYDQKIKLRAFSPNLDLSDIVIVSEFIETQEGTKIIPNIANLVTSKDTSLSFFYEVYQKGDSTLNVSYTIFDMEGVGLAKVDKKIQVVDGRNEIHETLDKIKFALGDYQLTVSVLDSNGTLLKSIKKIFYSKIFGFPSSVRDLDKSIRELRYIARADELSEIEKGKTYSDRLKLFIDFWKRLDPSPNTVENETLNEYYRRVEYANKHFGGYFEGWRSDMGMVYITLGPPDQVTRHPYEIDSKPYEIWEYYFINRTFIFVDYTNFGDYRLENPQYGDWFRYRP